LAPQPSEIKPDETPSKRAGSADLPMMEDHEAVDLDEEVLNE
jgi:hypothetical protein